MVPKSLLLIFLAVPLFADTGFYNTVQVTETDNSPKCQAGQIKFQPGQVACNGQTATVTITGGGGGSSLAVNQNAVQITSPTLAINGLSPPFIITSVGGGTTAQWTLDPSSVTLQGNGLLISNMLTQSSATATYLQSSSATSTYFQNTVIIPVANGGTGTTTPGLVPGTNITSITGTWPNQTINATTQGGGSGSSLAVTTGTLAGFATVASSPTSVLNFDNSTFNAFLAGSATAYISLNASSVTLQGQSVLSLSSATATYLQLSSASVTYVNKNQANAGTVTSVTGTSPINSSGGTTPAISLSPTIGQVETFTSSLTVTAPQGSSTTYGVYAGSITDQNLAASGNVCSSAGALTTSGCANGTLTANQSITWTGSGDVTGTASGATSLTPTLTNAALQSNITTFGSSVTFKNVLGSSTTWGVYAGSVTVSNLTASQYVKTDANKLLASQSGVPTTDLSGALQAAQFPALTGDITTSAGALATTAAAKQPNITTFTSSITVTNSSGFNVTYGATLSTMTASSATLSGQFTAGTYQGASLATCGDSSHGLGWSGGTFSCQSITGSASSPGGVKGNVQYNNPAGTFAGDANFNIWASSAVHGASEQLFTSGGISISSGIVINTTPVIVATVTLTSTMSVVLASAPIANAYFTITLPSAANNPGLDITLYKVDGSTNYIVINPSVVTELIEGTGTIRLNAIYQHASLHSLGAAGWASGLGGIQYTPYAITTVSMDNAAYITTISSIAVQCPIYTPIPVAVTAFRVDRAAAAGNSNASFGIFDTSGNFLVGLSTQALSASANNYSLARPYNLAPGWYKVAVQLQMIGIQLTGSNSLADVTSLCSVGATPTNIDISKITLTTGGNRNVAAPWIGLILNGGQQAN